MPGRAIERHNLLRVALYGAGRLVLAPFLAAAHLGKALWNLRRPDSSPGDPWAYSGAPVKPRPPMRSDAIALEEPD
jgi:hypothetical protein